MADFQVLTDRPNLRTTFPKRPAPTTTERPTTPQRQQTTNSRSLIKPNIDISESFETTIFARNLFKIKVPNPAGSQLLAVPPLLSPQQLPLHLPRLLREVGEVAKSMFHEDL